MNWANVKETLSEPFCDEYLACLDAEMKVTLVCVVSELIRARAKHPVYPGSRVVAAAIVAEESGELIRAALQHKFESGPSDAMEHEAVQTAASAIRFILNK